MLLGLLLALTCAAVTNTSFLLRERGAVQTADVDARHPVRSARLLFSSRWWTIGWLVAVAAWLLHVGALALMQLSLVQAVVAGGLVFLAVLGERFFGLRLGRRQWTGLAITAAGLVILGLTEGRGGPGAGASLGALISVESAVAVLSAGLVWTSVKLPRLHPAEGMILGVAAGTLFGLSDISVKYLTGAAHAGVFSGVLNGWIASALAASVVAFYASARSLQLGPAFEVIAFTSVAANLIAIGGGILIFHDPVGHGAGQIAGRMAAFCLVIAGAALMPAHTQHGDLRATAIRPPDAPPSHASAAAGRRVHGPPGSPSPAPRPEERRA
jgi:drug/metabolite transporter (DMT)-like permease